MTKHEFWSEIKVFNFDALDARYLTAEENKFTEAVKAISDCNEDKGVSLLKKLYRTAHCESIKRASSKILFQQLYWNDKFHDIHKLGLNNNEGIDASYRRMADILRRQNIKEIDFIASKHVDKMSLSISGSPVVRVKVNGIERNFWLDTGALMSCVSEKTAQVCGLEVEKDSQVDVESSTDGKVSVDCGFAEKLTLGNCEVSQLPLLVLPNEALTIEMPGSHDNIIINGLIGWDIIKHLDVTLNYKAGEILINKPQVDETLEKNIIMDGYLIVKGNDSHGSPLYLGSDTGANKTAFGEGFMHKFKHVELERETNRVGGITGFIEKENDLMKSFDFKINGKKFSLERVHKSLNQACTFFTLDGIIGSDICQDGCLRIDYTNRHFSVFKYE